MGNEPQTHLESISNLRALDSIEARACYHSYVSALSKPMANAPQTHLKRLSNLNHIQLIQSSIAVEVGGKGGSL